MSSPLPPTHAHIAPNTRPIYLQFRGEAPTALAALSAPEHVALHILPADQQAPAAADLVLIDATAVLPTHWLTRLLRHHLSAPDEILCTLTDRGEYALGAPVDGAERAAPLDAFCAALASGERFQVRGAPSAPLIWVPAALRARFDAGACEFWL